MWGMSDNHLDREAWRLRPWAIVLLILLAVAFGAQVAIVGLAFLTVSTGVMLACWVALLLMGLRKHPPPDPPAGYFDAMSIFPASASSRRHLLQEQRGARWCSGVAPPFPSDCRFQ
jgi:hypothetical protein